MSLKYSKRQSVLLLYASFVILAFLFIKPFLRVKSSFKTVDQYSHWSMVNHPNVRDQSAEPAWKNTTRAKAAFVILTRNSELDGVRKAMKQLEARFNRRFNYPYVFLNDEPFTEEFKELTTSLTNAETKYGIVYLDGNVWFARPISLSYVRRTDT